jgi:IS30 family transposase
LYWNKWYKKKRSSGNSKKSVIPHRTGIEDRPLAIWNRSEQWHFEADLIVSKKWFKGVLLTLIDRKSRKGQIIKLPNKETVWVISAIKQYKDTLWIKSITFDNGREFSHHYKLRKYGIYTYFCDTYASWQKGSVENYNGIIRRWLPKWTIFDHVSHNEIRSINDNINNTPRKILGFKSPNQVHAQYIQ